ncbi:MAG: exodeoxyribonuclease VII [Bacteroides sp. SM23_62_1]|nr:MAG: exodeoxyribonuclease VII [Bacteroides sp. SM23_62_1]
MTKEEISYQEAVTEIEEIIKKLESGELDVDQLTGEVKRVSYLLDICRKKLKTAEVEIQKIIEGMKEEGADDHS